MIGATGGLFALVLLAGVTSLYLHRASDVADVSAHGPITRLLGCLGIGDLPVLLAGGVFSIAAGAGGMAHVALSRQVFGSEWPAWVPAIAVCSAAGLGLAALRLTSAAVTARQQRGNLLR